MRKETKFLWYFKIYNNFLKKNGVLSDFEEVIGYDNQNKVVRDFLKELIEYGFLVKDGERQVNNNIFNVYKVDNKKFRELIEDTNEKLFEEIWKYINKNYTVL